MDVIDDMPQGKGVLDDINAESTTTIHGINVDDG